MNATIYIGLGLAFGLILAGIVVVIVYFKWIKPLRAERLAQLMNTAERNGLLQRISNLDESLKTARSKISLAVVNRDELVCRLIGRLICEKLLPSIKLSYAGGRVTADKILITLAPPIEDEFAERALVHMKYIHQLVFELRRDLDISREIEVILVKGPNTAVEVRSDD